MTTQKAISIIISMETLPSQIDYISPRQKRNLQNALDFIENLPRNERIFAEREIGKEINDYYESGAAYYDSLF